MISIESSGKSIDDAIMSGLKQLNLSIDEVKIEILEDKGNGLFGLGKGSLVRLTKKEGGAQAAEDFLNTLLDKMKIPATLVTIEEDDMIKIDIRGATNGALIGRRGETLDALQYLTSLVINKNSEDYKKIMVDCEDYRKKREETLVALAKRLAAKAKRYRKRVTLEPMNPYERRVFHAALQDDDVITTYSEGEEPYRHIVIDFKK